jgi:hemerythrin
MNDVYDYKLGIIWQDVQHRRIVEIIKELNSNPEVDYQSIQAQLMFYVEDHFDTEEQYMHRFA